PRDIVNVGGTGFSTNGGTFSRLALDCTQAWRTQLFLWLLTVAETLLVQPFQGWRLLGDGYPG
ncbi:MAG: hypothetical protein SH868_16715, partial [Bythopirellula sp.]|nr:hypothetical protein [Bythopirellula sp.]